MTPVHSKPCPSAPADNALHGAVDRIIRRQQGRLLGRLPELDRETTSNICQSIGWIGKDIHAAISGEYQEASRAIPQN